MGKGKLERFAEMETFPHVVQPSFEDIGETGHALKGKWGEDFFGRPIPLVLELGCGKGEYSLALARWEPGKNFLGVDIKGARMWRGARTALEEGLTNVGFLRSRIEFVASFFGEEEVEEIWLPFSDPQPKERWIKKRLTSPQFIGRYRKFLKRGGAVHLKTDNDILFDYTMEQIREEGYELLEYSRDVHGALPSISPEWQGPLSVKTFYEAMALEEGRAIKYVRFRIH